MALFLDVETDGIGTFRPPRQHLVQIAWIAPGGEERSFYIRDCATAINPRVPHTITLERLAADGVPAGVAFDALLKDLGHTRRVVGHNVEFDVGIVAAEAEHHAPHLAERLAALPTFCTMRNAVEFCGLPRRYGGLKYPTLTELHSALFDAVPPHSHDALEDCRATKKCLWAGVERGVYPKGVLCPPSYATP
jgi:DNA polymerase III epsilon subunit-like protein